MTTSTARHKFSLCGLLEDRNFLTPLILFGALLSVTLVSGCALPWGGGDAGGPPSFNDSHFTVASITSSPCFEGERLVVQARIVDDEPEREIVVTTESPQTVTGSDGKETVTVMPTAVTQLVGGNGTHTVVAVLTGGPGVNVTRSEKLSLANNQSKVLVFDFGQVPAGSYVVTVTAPSYNDSRKSASVTVGAAPSLNQWTPIGDVAFLLDNLAHGSVDVNVRNDGQHTVIFGSQYNVYVNCSGGYGIALQGLNNTLVQPGQAVTVRATIAIKGDYYLEYFAIAAPGRATLVKIPVGALVVAKT
jgi:hypothetical protein